MNPTIYTIGHSTQPVAQFVAKLQKYGINAIADVRSTPFSRHNPQFNKDELQLELEHHGIRYVFLGNELGARSRDECCYMNDKVQYARLAETESFKLGIARVVDGASRFKIALMCAEKDPEDCHRSILVARYVIREGFEVQHILADGSLEAQETTLQRLVNQLERENSRDLFNAGAALTFEDVYETQGRRIAYDRSSQHRHESHGTYGTAPHLHGKDDGK